MKKLCGLFLVGASLASMSWAQNYPSRPIGIVVPTAPGGGPDVVARAIAPRLTDTLGQQIVVENRAGANAMIGAEVVAKAPPGPSLMLKVAAFKLMAVFDTAPKVNNGWLTPTLPPKVMVPIPAVTLRNSTAQRR